MILSAPDSATGVRRFLTTMTKAIALDTCGGRRYHPTTRNPETSFSVKILAVGGVTLSRRRHVVYGQIHSILSTPSKKSRQLMGHSGIFLPLNPTSQSVTSDQRDDSQNPHYLKRLGQ